MGGLRPRPFPSSLLAVPNVTAHPSTASVPITVLLYDSPLLCGFNVAIKGSISGCATVSRETVVPIADNVIDNSVIR